MISIIIYFILFIILTPGIVFRLPIKGSKYVVALVHSIIFASIIL